MESTDNGPGTDCCAYFWSPICCCCVGACRKADLWRISETALSTNWKIILEQFTISAMPFVKHCLVLLSKYFATAWYLFGWCLVSACLISSCGCLTSNYQASATQIPITWHGSAMCCWKNYSLVPWGRRGERRRGKTTSTNLIKAIAICQHSSKKLAKMACFNKTMELFCIIKPSWCVSVTVQRKVVASQLSLFSCNVMMC